MHIADVVGRVDLMTTMGMGCVVSIDWWTRPTQMTLWFGGSGGLTTIVATATTITFTLFLLLLLLLPPITTILTTT
jgi:hypothetical protein